MQLTRPLHEDSPQWEWFKRAVVTTIKKNGKVDYDTKIRLTSTIIWCLGAFDVVRKTINLTYQGKVAPWNAKYNIVEKKTRQKYPDTLKGRIALNKVLFAFFRASQVEKNTDTGTEAIAMFGMERLNRKGKLIRTGLITLALGSGLFLTLGNRHSTTDVKGTINGYDISGPVSGVMDRAQAQHSIKNVQKRYEELKKVDRSSTIRGNNPNKFEDAFKGAMKDIKEKEQKKKENLRLLDEQQKQARSDGRAKEDEYFKAKNKYASKETEKKIASTDDPRVEQLALRNADRYDKKVYQPMKKLYDQGYRNVKNMEFSDKGYDMLKLFEGYSSTAYKDVGGVWTVGTGHTGSLSAIGKDRDVQQGDTITDHEGNVLAYHGPGGIKIASKAVRDLVKVKLTQAQFDALVSFVYNNGRGAFARSTLLTHINSMKDDVLLDSTKKAETTTKIGTELAKHCKVKNKVYNGLKKRRAKEFSLFKDGTYPTSLD